MTRKRISTAVSMLFVLVSLAACGGGGGGGTTGGATPSPPAVPAATAVGTTTGASATATIGAAGGSVRSTDNLLTVIIPPGALAADTVIGIQPLTNKAHGGLGAAYRLTPDGQAFLQPITLRFAYTDQQLSGSDPAILGAAFQTATGYWQWVGTPVIDSVAKTGSIQTAHFTDFSMVQGYRLQPLSKTVGVNQTAALQAVFCYPPALKPGDDPAPLGLACDTAASQGEVAAPFLISEWSVNGVAGGSGSTGTVSGNGPAATYTAPATKPTPSIVAVSARVDLGTKGKTLVVSNITITDAALYSGDIRFSGTRADAFETISYSGVARVEFIRISDDGQSAIYTLSTDPLATNVTFDKWDYSDSIDGKVCRLVGVANTPYPAAPPAGQLHTYGASASYSFAAVIQFQGTQRCVSGGTGTVTVEPVYPGVMLSTSPQPTDPGFQPLGDGRHLVGSVNMIDPSGINQHTEWDLTRSF